LCKAKFSNNNSNDKDCDVLSWLLSDAVSIKIIQSRDDDDDDDNDDDDNGDTGKYYKCLHVSRFRKWLP
jgi:hypothetical protein